MKNSVVLGLGVRVGAEDSRLTHDFLRYKCIGEKNQKDHIQDQNAQLAG